MRNIKCVPTSFDTELLLRRFGLPVTTLSAVDRIDIAVDGADSVYLNRRLLIKGGGGALLREKIVDYSAREFLVLVDYSKIDREFPVPLEILPFAYSSVLLQKLKVLGEPALRMAKNKLGPIITDNGNWIIDLRIDASLLNRSLEIKFNATPGILENGIFTRDARILISTPSGDIYERKI